MHHIFIYNGRSSVDFGLVLSGEDTWGKPMPDVERMQIPGRNGDLLLSNHRYSNVEVTYHVGIKRGFATNFNAFMNFLLKEPGYHRLEDSYHGKYYRMAVLDKNVTPKMNTLNHSGTFDLTFSCMPQQYLKDGQAAGGAFFRGCTIVLPLHTWRRVRFHPGCLRSRGI